VSLSNKFKGAIQVTASKTIKVEKNGHVAWVILDNPEKRKPVFKGK